MRIVKLIKLFIAATLIMYALNVVGSQDLEYEHQRAWLVGYSEDK